MSILMPRLFGDLTTGWFDVESPLRTQSIRVEDCMNDHNYVVRAELPGLDPAKGAQVSVDSGVLTIHAERQERREGRSRSEFRYGELERSIRLPANADTEHITATYRDGILEVTVPLPQEKPTTGRQIPISS